MKKEKTHVAYYKKRTYKEKVRIYKKIKVMHWLSNFFMTVGVMVLIYFLLFPVFLAYAYVSPSNKILRPIQGSVFSYIQNVKQDEFYFAELDKNKWKPKKQSQTQVEKFYLSIPKLGIENAVVEANSTDLTPDDALGHYKGTSIPGEVGNAFIYGHSTLPILYDSKNYKTIFTKIPKLKNGDRIYVNINGKELTYKVTYKKEMLPKEVNPYGEYYPTIYNKSTITLMTCTPPGTKKYRYIVLAELQSQK